MKATINHWTLKIKYEQHLQIIFNEIFLNVSVMLTNRQLFKKNVLGNLTEI